MWLTLSSVLLLAASVHLLYSISAVSPKWDSPVTSDTKLANSTTHSICVAIFLRRPYRGSPYTMLKAEKSTLLYMAMVLLLNASDVALNPGPQAELSHSDTETAYMCGACKIVVTWDEKGLLCETCDTWFHADCQGVGDSTYEDLGNSSVTWLCSKCSGTNYSSVLFDLHGIGASSKHSDLNNTSATSNETLLILKRYLILGTLRLQLSQDPSLHRDPARCVL